MLGIKEHGIFMGQEDTFSRSDYEDELLKYDQLLRAAISVSRASGGIKTSTRYIRSSQIFTRMVVIAYTFMRLLPSNPITRDKVEHRDSPTVAAIARNFLEAYLHFFYIGADDILEEEVEFRLMAMWFHLNSEKYQLYKSGSRDIDLTEFEVGLPNEKQRLREHRFFQQLTKEQQKRVLSGKSSTYMTRSELIKRLPFRVGELSWMYRHYSNEVHSTAFAFTSLSNERGRGDENPAERGYTISAIWLVRKYLASAIIAMARIFPEKIGNGEKKAVILAEGQFHRLTKEEEDA